MSRIELGPFFLDILSADELLSSIKALISARKPSQLITLNSLMFNAGLEDPELAPVLRGAALVIPDSVGIVWAARLLRDTAAHRHAGIDLLFEICAVSAKAGYKVYLLGSAHGVAEKTAENLKKLFPGLVICGTHHGYLMKQDESEVVKDVSSSGADILFVGMSVPHQEKWIARNLEKLGVPVVMGIGGSFDVISGSLKRAPVWIQNCGFEWLFRTLQQPWRFFRIISLPLFVINVIKLKLSNMTSTTSS